LGPLADGVRTERHAGAAVVHRPRLRHQPVEGDGAALRQTLWLAGHLDADDVGLAVAHGHEVDVEQRHAVGVGLDSLGLEVAHRLGVLDQQEHQTSGVDRQLHPEPHA
jgi:hypothetical protein